MSTAAHSISAAPTVAPPRERRSPDPPPRPPRSPDRGGSSGGDEGAGGVNHEVVITGMWIALAPILMLFMAFVSAYVVRQGLGSDWVQVPVPRLLWFNTFALVLSGVALERGKRRAISGDQAGPWVGVALGLGLLFLLGQLIAWRELLGRGIGMSTTPYSSFFYLLTGAHGVHVVLGLVGLGVAALWPADGRSRLPRAVVIRLAAIYWHFMGLLWVGLFLLLLFRR